MRNQFGRISELNLATELRRGETVLSDVFFTAPFKVMHPFKKDNGIQVMMMSASAGIMDGDVQQFSFRVGEGSGLEFVSQSFEKIHRMKEGYARRETKVMVEKEARFDFHPQPTIPFTDSAYQNRMDVELADESSRFGMYEILSCGRVASGERFGYRYYHSLVQIRRGGHLIYRDNTRYQPRDQKMEETGMYEGYTHLANIFLTGNRLEADGTEEQLRTLVAETPDTEGGVTELASGDIAVRILGRRAQQLQQIVEEIQKLVE